jgi:hypothetical protein
MELENVPHTVSQAENKGLDLSASAGNHASTSEFGAQTVVQQPVQEVPDFANEAQDALNSELHVLQDKGYGGEEISQMNGVQLKEPSLHSRADNLRSLKLQDGYTYAGVALNAAQPGTSLPDVEPQKQSSPSSFDPESGQLVTQQEEPDSDVPRIQAYAKLEFDDGEFYMNTYSVELGRDLEAARIASEWEQEEWQMSLKRRRPSSSSEDASQASLYTTIDDERHVASSVISESGGIIGPEVQDSHVRKRSKISRSKSATSSSQQLSRKSSLDLHNGPMPNRSPVTTSLIDPSTLDHADPEACPLIRIHPPATSHGVVAASHKGISRRHVKIAFNFEKHVFELTILGRNGAFVDERWYKEGDTLALKNGSLIQIGGVRVRFLLPDMSSGPDGADVAPSYESVESFDVGDVRILEDELNRDGLTLENSSYESSFTYSSSGDDGNSEQSDPMADEDYSSTNESEEYERGSHDGEKYDGRAHEHVEGPYDHEELDYRAHVESLRVANTSEQKELEAKPRRLGGRQNRNGKATAKVKRSVKAPRKPLAKTTPQPKPQSNLGSIPQPTAPVVKRKGPGRPPKNGIMSKREQKLLAKQAQEEAGKAADQPSSEEKAVDKNQGDVPAQSIPTKRKYTKRKSKDVQPGQDPVRQSTERTPSLSMERNSEALPKATKEKKPAKPPRSPSPVYDRSTMTKEELAKPNISYAYVIADVLKDAPEIGMSLPQIYRAMERRYPYFKVEVTTVGWQSSVRHNLSQHRAFVKKEREGKGWLWVRDPNIPIEENKKKKTISPTPPQPTPPNPPKVHASVTYQQPQMVPAQHNLIPHHRNIPPNVYSYQGAPVANGHLQAQIGYQSYNQAGPYAQLGSFHQGVKPNNLPMPFVNSVSDTSSTYESPYKPTDPNQPPQPPLQQQIPTAVSTGFDRHHDSGVAAQPPPPAFETSTNPPPAHSPSPAPQSQSPGHPITMSPNTSQEINHAIAQFKINLVNSMKDHKHGETLVTSAINRVLGLQNSSSLPGNEEDPQEQAIMRIFSKMLEDLKKKSSLLQGQGSQPPSQLGGGNENFLKKE